MNTAHIGKPVNRVDGCAKVTGQAKYAAERNVHNLVHGHLVCSSIAKGKITAIDTSEALRLPGILRVFTHENSPRLARSDSDYSDNVAPPGSPFRPLHDAEIKFSQQPIALVVADSLELASYAASLVRVEYERETHVTDLYKEFERARDAGIQGGHPAPSSARGNPGKAFDEAAVRVEAEYRAPGEHHNPMEPFATTVLYDEDGGVTVYDKTQGVQNVQSYLCKVFGCSKEEVRVFSPFVGGGFGAGLRPQYQAFLAVLAARELKRSVRVSSRASRCSALSHRPATWQRVSLGASRDGKLEAVMHEAVGRDLAIRGFHRERRQLVGPALSLRQCQARLQGRGA